MLKTLKENGRLNETLFLGFSTLACLSFSLYRVYYTGSTTYLFLNWNLFLAFVPWLITTITFLKPKLKNSKTTLIFTMLIWLLFFPNAPYIFTDLFHLRFESEMPIWFDLILILSYAWTGLLFGFFSLWDLEKMMQNFIRSKYVPVISIVLLFLSSFGIYLGRYLRWNSWDLITSPKSLIYDVGSRFIHPLDHPRTWGMTLFLGVFLCIIYGSLRLIKQRLH